jgi:hypothetical protein
MQYETRRGNNVVMLDDCLDGKWVKVGVEYVGDKRYSRLWDKDNNSIEGSDLDLVVLPDIPEGFIRWRGGKECPVDGGAKVEYVTRAGGKIITGLAKSVRWTHAGFGGDVMAYKVVAPAIPDGFTPWNGGECPVPNGSKVDLILRSDIGTYTPGLAAEEYRWSHINKTSDIIAYRLITPAYRAFTNGDEFMPRDNERVRWKDTSRKERTNIHTYSDIFVWVGINEVGMSYAEAFEKLEFLDGTPFGVKQ